MANYKIFSFFSGSGFLDLGFEMSGFDIEFVNEFSKSFLDAYIFSRKKMNLRSPKYGYGNTDINEYLYNRAEELSKYVAEERKSGNLIGFIGGPPCPDFSVAGKQRGRNGDNGKLSKSYFDLIITQNPDFFLFENVKGLWRTAKHREFFEELKSDIIKAGYCTTERLTNALEFGAPQDRDRILMIGIKKSLFKKYPVTEKMDFNWTKNATYCLEDIKSFPWPTTNEFLENSITVCPAGIPESITVEYWFQKNNVEDHPNALDYFKPHAGLERMKTIAEGDDSKKSFKRIHRWRYSPTVCYGNNEVHLHPYKIRRLSVAEALAIQSLPKEFQLPTYMTLTDKFKTTGNGVPFVLSKGIAKTLKEYLDEGIRDGKFNSL